ncbi:MAG: tRNA(Ser) Um(44) 2'-O-methyltransferase, partial [Pleopsidium flavum]
MLFEPLDLTAPDSSPGSILPGELWTPILEHGCAFPPYIFVEVMLNLIKNPNINSSHLFRADILYDSYGTLACSNEEDLQKLLNSTLKEHGKDDADLPDFELQRTVIRNLIPRNPQLDKPLVQTCYFLKSNDGEKGLVLYSPHASRPDEVPHYHPAVSGIAFLHDWKPSESKDDSDSHLGSGTISIYYALFPSTTINDRLSRTAYQLLSILYKHGQGSLAGYVKRVHHDQIIPQQRFQDTYAQLKARHAKRLIENWVEQTQPSKHVFEDLGIAAFLIELWKDMYGDGPGNREANSKDKFPGFVDIGCGNGVLVDILLKEGYKGWGFDARKRKTWETFTPD